LENHLAIKPYLPSKN